MSEYNSSDSKESKAPAPDTSPVYEYITTETTAYRTQGVPLADNWDWSMFEHIRRSFLYKNSKFAEGENDNARPFKNVVRPILNVAYRAEGFDVKDITPFVDDDRHFAKSFFVKKFAHKWGIDNGLDTFIDEVVESFVDFGLALVKKVKGARPLVVKLQTLAFCDQSDILSGPLCELDTMTVSELNAMRGKWNEEAIDIAIDKCSNGKMVIGVDKEAKTPGKYAQVFKLHGTFPETWMNDYPQGKTPEGELIEQKYTDDSNYVKQLHVVAYYYDDDNNQQGICFFKGPEKADTFMALKRDDVFGRACGFGGVEELFDAQQWTNMSEIQQQEMLEIASLMLLQVAEGSGKTKNILTELEKGEVLEHEENHPYSQLNLTPQNMTLFKDAVDRWNQAARTIGSADEALLGQAPAAGTPFSLQALIVQQGFGLHEYRKGKLATFIGDVYRLWILPQLVSDMKKGHKWLASLSLDEMQGLVENIVNIEAWNLTKSYMMQGQLPTEQQMGAFKDQVRELFMKDSKKFLELIENELDGIATDVEVDVAGKQYNLQDRADKLTNIFRQVMQNPQVFQVPGMAKLFNEIIEASGFSPVDFNGITKQLPPAAAAPTPEGAPAAAPITKEAVAA